MTIIRVDPAILNQCANRMNGVQNAINQVSRNVSNACNSAPSYDGQFGPRVRSIGQDAASRARDAASWVSDHSEQLQRKAQAFINADLASQNGLGSYGIGRGLTNTGGLNQGLVFINLCKSLWDKTTRFVSLGALRISHTINVLSSFIYSTTRMMVVVGYRTAVVTARQVGATIVFISSGINALYQTGRREFGKAVNQLSATSIQLVRASDLMIATLFTGLLQSRAANSSKESVTYKVNGQVTIPGLLIADPANSFLVSGADEVRIERDPETGKYTVTFIKKGGVGVEEPLLKAKARARIGKNYGLGVDAKVNAQVVGDSEYSYEFDPNNFGDMSKMMALLMATGAGEFMNVVSPGGSSIPLTNVLTTQVGPTLASLSDNFVGMKTGFGVEAEGNANASALVKLAGVDAQGELKAGSELKKSETTGHWEKSTYAEFEDGCNVQVVTIKEGVTGTYIVETVKDLTTQETKTVVTLKVNVEAGKSLNLQDMGKYVTKKAFQSMPVDGISSSETEYREFTIKYTLNEPADAVIESIKNNNLMPIVNNSELQIIAMQGSESGLGAEVQLGAASQGIGLSGDVTSARETEVVIFDSTKP